MNRIPPRGPLGQLRSPIERSLRMVAILALIGVLASALQLVRSHAELDSLRAVVSERLIADDPCVGARAMSAQSCPHRFELSRDPDPAISASDVGVVEGTPPFLGGCAHHLIGTDVLNKHCVWQTTGATRTIALVGDSHAAQWADGLLDVASARHWNVEVYFHGGCLLSDVSGRPSEAVVSSACTAWSASVGDQLRRRNDLDAVVYGSHAAAYVQERAEAPNASEDVVDSAVASISSWKDSARQVLVLRDVPNPGSDVPRCLASAVSAGAQSDPCSASREQDAPLDDHESERIASRLGLPLIDTTDLFCDDATCHSVIGGVLVYRDDDHLTASFARTAGAALADRIERAAGLS